MYFKHLILAGAVFALATGPSMADEDVAKQLNNPVANLISFPIQSSFDFRVGPNDGWRATTNIQPVVPFSLNADWNLISRTIVPVVYQNGVIPGQGAQFGLSDTAQSLFLSPAAPMPTSLGNLIVGAGPIAAIPTSTDEYLGAGTLGFGPTGVVLFQKGPWTYGGLANHLWGAVETRSNAPDLNATFLQPFVAYTTSDAWTFSINSELTYNWAESELSGPVNVGVSKLLSVGDQLVQLQGRARYWAAETDSSPEGLGFGLTATFVFPTK
ncbi:hypothetical protein [Roseibium alexandrii]|uniref:Transporter n=1 Tax=Roseibium alexandrii (strain DSM 17067 / NCIMB 14079 / DFL-11) TaxID=244592 RepID=A0A5E8GU24_ROSAD|nr:hypothetical protein [Roseibium alexandrii]EEE43316.1 hypothetical protein SADFL11_602 [Roseibium alexandrii DFL-11]